MTGCGGGGGRCSVGDKSLPQLLCWDMALGLVVVVGVVVIAGSVDAIILVIVAVAVALGLTWSWRRLVRLLVWLPVAVSAEAVVVALLLR